MYREPLQKEVLEWFRQNKRDLPWRKTRDPYRIWISEIMLQQTLVKTVLPYYERFLARFPDLHSLAQADESEVVALWSGLGYYGRARNLHRAACQICAQRKKFSWKFEELLKLPGVGRYTAGAVSSIAFDEKHAVVDGNVRRLLSRYFGKVLGVGECWKTAESLLPQKNTGDFNQALMEIGATICRPENPLCLICPLRQDCQTKGAELPGLRAAARAVPRNMAMLLLGKDGKFWLEDRGPSQELLKNLWCFPLELGAAPIRELEQRLLHRYRPLRADRLGDFTHSIMKFRFRISVLTAAARGKVTGKGAWIRPGDLRNYPHSSLAKKALRLAGLEPT